MYKAPLRAALALCLLAGGTANPVYAQFGQFNPAFNPTQRPIISPWLNLTRGGNAGINYYGLVRPEFNFIAANRQLGQEVTLAQQTANLAATQPGVIDPNLPVTGHPVGFQTQRRYFMNLGSGLGQGRYGSQGANRPGVLGAGSAAFTTSGFGQGAGGQIGAQGATPARTR
jgi:hypothetical protein